MVHCVVFEISQGLIHYVVQGSAESQKNWKIGENNRFHGFIMCGGKQSAELGFVKVRRLGQYYV
jgi:hypothetical protein